MVTIKALARAFRWRKMLDAGVYSTINDLAKAKAVNATYVSRILRLTLLAPDLVEAILDGRQPAARWPAPNWWPGSNLMPGWLGGHG